MSTFMDINMAMRPVNAVFRKGVMFISSDEVIRVRKGSGDINGGLSQTSGGQNRLARMINFDARPVGMAILPYLVIVMLIYYYMQLVICNKRRA